MTNPLPDCGRTSPGACGPGLGSSKGPGSELRRRRPLDRDVASMLTTAGFRVSATSAKFTSPEELAGRAATSEGLRVSGVCSVDTCSPGGAPRLSLGAP